MLGKPLRAAVFLCENGLILLAGERLRRKDEARASARGVASESDEAETGSLKIDTPSSPWPAPGGAPAWATSVEL